MNQKFAMMERNVYFANRKKEETFFRCIRCLDVN